jgi:hypothetical protein
VPESHTTTQPTQHESSAANADLDHDTKPSGPQLRPEAVHVHGVDDMSTKDIEGYFSDYQPIKIEWVNDTSCKSKFHQQNHARYKHADIHIVW